MPRSIPLTSKIARALLGEERAGFLAYYLRPRLRNRWGGPFNGQRQRQQIFRDVLAAMPFSAIVETGTYRGDTTVFLRSESRLPVFTVESHASHYGFSRARFLSDPGVRVFHDDSRVFLRRLASMRDLQGRMLFFYLDAHWRDDLPIREEVEIISTHWPDALVMVDDFAVPDDPGYGYDDYGEGRALTLELIRSALRASPAVYFPAAPSAAETGSRRGCVVLAFHSQTDEVLGNLPSLRRSDQ